MNDVVDVGNGYVPVEISSGTQLNWRYYFPIEHSGDGRYAFAPNHATVDGKYYSCNTFHQLWRDLAQKHIDHRPSAQWENNSAN